MSENPIYLGFFLFCLFYYLELMTLFIAEVRPGAGSTAGGVSAVEYSAGLRPAGLELCTRHTSLGQPPTQRRAPPVLQVPG